MASEPVSSGAALQKGAVRRLHTLSDKSHIKMKTPTIILTLLAFANCALSQTAPPTQQALTKPHVVQEAKGYNSWPMIQAIEEKLVCIYSRGSGHTIGEDARAVYARTSADGGKTWTAETVVANSPGYGEVEVGKGLDSKGAMLLWVRRVGKDWHHDLYRTTDGVTFTVVATPQLAVPSVCSTTR